MSTFIAASMACRSFVGVFIEVCDFVHVSGVSSVMLSKREYISLLLIDSWFSHHSLYDTLFLVAEA